MSIFDSEGNVFSNAYDCNGNLIRGVFDSAGILMSGDYTKYSSEYERNILLARDSWIAEAREDETIIPLVIHTDQHGRLTADNTLFPYLAKAVPWEDVSACIGLGDTTDYNLSRFQAMETCLSSIPKDKQINIWGNHDTWHSGKADNPALQEEHLTVLNTYFDNSAFNGNHKFNDYGIECMIDEERNIKYVVIGGWEYDVNLGGYSHYVIGSDSMDAIIQMLSANDGYDIVILSHIQPFATQTADSWTYPPAEGGAQGGSGSMDYSAGVVVYKGRTTLDQMLKDRQNRASGTVKDSYQNVHTYDFTNCTGNILACFAGHEHCDKYMYQNDNIPIYLFDAYAYDKRPFYFVNINRTQGCMNMWKIDMTPNVYNYTIPLQITK